MGTRVTRQRFFSHNGFSAGDVVSHSKIGTTSGRIIFFTKFADGVYALVDYGERKRFERVEDLIPMRVDIYAYDLRDEEDGTG